MGDQIYSVNWDLDDEGGGTVLVFVQRGSRLIEQEYSFASLDELPNHIGTPIRDDGRRVGEWTPARWIDPS